MVMCTMSYALDVVLSGWNSMTPRDEWLLNSTMILPSHLNSSSSDEEAMDHSQQAQDFVRNVQLTRKAVSMGVALAALDGPLPVMDTVAFVGVSIYTSYLWGTYYLDYYV